MIDGCAARHFCHLDALIPNSENQTMEATLDYAEMHFSQLLQQVALGEEVLLRQGTVAVARIVPVKSSSPLTRPRVGERTSAPVRWNVESFAALDQAGMQELGML
jgi:antitoxin (DNA-binding transcriptional repressor) of toxin-antitoxin stability system